MQHRTYVFQGDYGDRQTEAEFIKDTLSRFDKNTLTGCGVFVNNNIYNLQLFMYFTLEKQFDEFEDFVRRKYSGLTRSYNMFTDAMLDDATRRAGNIATFVDDLTVDLVMIPGVNSTFLWPSKKIVDERWSYFITPIQLNAFLSHKSVDKAIATQIKNYLNSSQVSVWFDEQEILPGMSIVDSISAGLERCQGCIALISQDFLESAAKWTRMELNYFLSMMGGGESKYLIPVLLNVSHKQLPPLLQDIKALAFGEVEWERKLLAAVKHFTQANKNTSWRRFSLLPWVEYA